MLPCRIYSIYLCEQVTVLFQLSLIGVPSEIACVPDLLKMATPVSWSLCGRQLEEPLTMGINLLSYPPCTLCYCCLQIPTNLRLKLFLHFFFCPYGAKVVQKQNKQSVLSRVRNCLLCSKKSLKILTSVVCCVINYCTSQQSAWLLEGTDWSVHEESCCCKKFIWRHTGPLVFSILSQGTDRRGSTMKQRQGDWL